MSALKHTAVALCIAAGTLAGTARAAPPSAIVKQVMKKSLGNDFPGKEAVMITVVYPPGAADPVHRHNAYGFIYVLEGTIVMQVRGGRQVTLKPGQTFYEGPDDVHTIGRNASKTRPAKFLALLLKNKSAPLLVPE